MESQGMDTDTVNGGRSQAFGFQVQMKSMKQESVVEYDTQLQ